MLKGKEVSLFLLRPPLFSFSLSIGTETKQQRTRKYKKAHKRET